MNIRVLSKYKSIFNVEDSHENALAVLNAIWLSSDESILVGLQYLIDTKPEIRKCSHQYISELMGVRRETISRIYKHLTITQLS